MTAVEPTDSNSCAHAPAPKGRRVLLAQPRGYCAGVDRAVRAVEHALQRYGPPIYVRNEIVHNRHVVSALRERGVVFVANTAEVPAGAVMMFSAHGVSPAVRAEAAERRLRVIDATCPLVTKVHNEVIRFARRGYDILLIGHIGHEEVEGTFGEAPDHIQIVDAGTAIDAINVRDESRVVWLSQTTLSIDETKLIVERLRRRFPLLQQPPADDICYATQNRQRAVKDIAPQCDLMIVVGSGNSSNAVRLTEVACEAGVPVVHRVDAAAAVDARWLQGVSTVGVTSGASVPEILVNEVLAALAEQGFTDVSTVSSTEETVVFAPPGELRRQISSDAHAESVR